MARIKGKYIIGAVGSVTYKQTKHGGVISSRVRTVQQTDATKKSAAFFGNMSVFNKNLRVYLSAVGHQDTGLMTRLNKEMLGIISPCYDKETKVYDFSKSYFGRLNGIDLNDSSPLKDYLYPLPSCHQHENKLIVNIPEMVIHENLIFAAYASICVMQLKVIHFDLNGGYLKDVDVTRLIINSSDTMVAAQEFTFETFPGTLSVLAIGLQYYKKENGFQVALNSVDFSPSAIIFAMFSKGVFSEKIKETNLIQTEEGMKSTRITIWDKKHSGFPFQQLPVE